MTTARSCDLVGAVKETLTMDQVARRYGFDPSRAGFIKCPFHAGDRTASLKLYPGERGWHCFGCNRGGSVIDFVMELYGLDFRQAVVRLSFDFGLGLTDTRPSPAARSKIVGERRRERERLDELKAAYQDVADVHLFLHRYMIRYAPTREEWEQGDIDPVYAWAIQRLPVVEYHCEELSRGLMEIGR